MPIITAPKRVEQERGKEVRLQCIVEGYPRGNVTWWYKGKQLIKDYRTTFSVYDSTSHTARYSLIISALESYDFGVYTCKASNNAGTTQGQIELSQILSGTCRSLDPALVGSQCWIMVATFNNRNSTLILC